MNGERPSTELDLFIPWSPAKVLTESGRPLSRGKVTIQIPPGTGMFVPEVPLPLSVQILPDLILLVDVSDVRPLEASEWEYCTRTDGGCFSSAPHYHFSTAQRYV